MLRAVAFGCATAKSLRAPDGCHTSQPRGSTGRDAVSSGAIASARALPRSLGPLTPKDAPYEATPSYRRRRRGRHGRSCRDGPSHDPRRDACWPRPAHRDGLPRTQRHGPARQCRPLDGHPEGRQRPDHPGALRRRLPLVDVGDVRRGGRHLYRPADLDLPEDGGHLGVPAGPGVLPGPEERAHPRRRGVDDLAPALQVLDERVRVPRHDRRLQDLRRTQDAVEVCRGHARHPFGQVRELDQHDHLRVDHHRGSPLLGQLRHRPTGSRHADRLR